MKKNENSAVLIIQEKNSGDYMVMRVTLAYTTGLQLPDGRLVRMG